MRKILLKHSYLAIFPLLIFGFLNIGFFIRPETYHYSGKITNVKEEIAFLRGFSRRSESVKLEIECLTIEMNDSMKFISTYLPIKNELKHIDLIGQEVDISYYIAERYKMPRFFGLYYYLGKEQEFLESLIPYNSIESIKFRNGKELYIKLNIYYFAIFLISLAWLILGIINEIKIIIKKSHKLPLTILYPRNESNINGRIIKNFTKCPGCAKFLKDSDMECPDCGLNFR